MSAAVWWEGGIPLGWRDVAAAGAALCLTLLVGCGTSTPVRIPAASAQAAAVSAASATVAASCSPAAKARDTKAGLPFASLCDHAKSEYNLTTLPPPPKAPVADIRLLGLVQQPPEFSQIEPVQTAPGTVVRDLFAVAAPGRCPDGRSPCGSVLWASSDAGKTWTVRYASTKWDIRGVQFISPEVGWLTVQAAACASGTSPCPEDLWHTADGGGQWTPVAYGATDLAGFYAFNANDLWVVNVVNATSDNSCSPSACTTQVFGSTDGGRQWTEEYHVAGGADMVGGLTARQGSAGQLEAWMFLANGQVLVLQNGGQSWQPAGRITEGVPALGGRMQFLNGQDGWLSFCDGGTAAGGCVNYLYGTTDGGQTWNLLYRTAGESQWISVDMQTTLHGLMVVRGVNPGFQGPSNGNTVMATSDGGRTWKHVVSAPGSIELAAFSPGQLWIVGTLGMQCRCAPVIMESATTGAWKWNLRDTVQDVPTFPQVALVGGRLIGFSAAASGQVTVLTSAQGTTWTPVGTLPQPGGYYLHSLQGTPNGPYVWVGIPCTASPYQSCVLASGNGGVTWSQHALKSCSGEPWCAAAPGSSASQPPIPAAYCCAVTSVTPGGTRVVAVMGRKNTTGGAVFLHAPGGPWREIALPGVSPNRVAFATSSFGLIGTLSDRYFVISDGGMEWTQIL